MNNSNRKRLKMALQHPWALLQRHEIETHKHTHHMVPKPYGTLRHIYCSSFISSCVLCTPCRLFLNSIQSDANWCSARALQKNSALRTHTHTLTHTSFPVYKPPLPLREAFCGAVCFDPKLFCPMNRVQMALMYRTSGFELTCPPFKRLKP